MKEQNAKSLQTELAKASWFVGLSQSIEEWRQLQNIFLKNLNPDLVPHCQFACYKNHTLFLLVESGAWAARIRYLKPDLLNVLKTYPEFSKIRTIKCQVDPGLFSSILQP